MLGLVKRGVLRLLSPIIDRRLPAPTNLELESIEALRRSFLSLPAREPGGRTPSEGEWIINSNRLRDLVLQGDVRGFLRWDVILKTMASQRSGYTTQELRFLKGLPDWRDRWRRAIEESPIGHPWRYPLYPRSSGTLIQHAYSVAQFEARTKVRVNELRYVLEFGGGYGCMCKLFHNLGFRGKYLIFDLPAFSALQEHYLRSAGLNVLSADSPKDAETGVVCLSSVAELRGLIGEHGPGQDSLFVATWSISETPITLRASIMPMLADFGAYLIAYQDRFEEVNNLDFFAQWRQGLGARVQWHEWPIQHLPRNSYLVGRTL